MAGTKRKCPDGGGGPSPPPPSTAAAAAASAEGNDPRVVVDVDVDVDPRESFLSTSSSLFEYLERLPPPVLRSMYALPPPRGPIVAASVLRSCRLTELSRQVALRLAACGGSFGAGGIVEGWTRGGGTGGGGRRRGNGKGGGDGLLALQRLEAMGILEPTLGLARRRLGIEGGMGMPGTDDDDDDEGGGEDWMRRLMEKDACLTPEFGASIRIYLSTSSSSPWPIITTEQIDAHRAGNSARPSSYSSTGDNDGGKPSREPPTRRELEEYTQSSWDSVLHFLVGSDDDDRRGDGNDESVGSGGGNDGGGRQRNATTIEEPSDAMVQFLTRIGLMQEDPDYVGKDRSRAPLVITSKGYEFMLRDINAQVWQFVLQYLNSMKQHEMTDTIRVDALSFLICLGSTRVGEGYHISVLGKSKYSKQVMKDFGRFGLVFVSRVAGKVSFYPTRVAVNLIASNEKATAGVVGGGGGRGNAEDGGTYGQSVAATRSLEEALAAPVPPRSHLAVIVQTNFQVVAYTRSRLHISTLGLFCEVQSYRRLPNVIFFRLSRDSVRGAFRLGVTADQILRFLHVHAHPTLRSDGRALVPPNVRDQIVLWDRERRRVVMEEVCVHQCRDAAEFAAVGHYASDLDALAWGATHTNKLYVHYRKNDQVQAYVRKWRTRQLGK
ncbi:hypothetical protein ACHAW5_011053 [Stephanodiscus triporus]|uniref:General transcription factor IIH subunit 4 n=1 Tax=Stephanodiscus triporus TaxID=2934178 RepID=A0ABD3NKQ8_9STRA